MGCQHVVFDLRSPFSFFLKSCSIIYFFLLQCVYAAPVTSLEEVLQETLSRHPNVKARQFDLQAAQLGIKAAQGLFDLQLNGTIDLADDLVTIPNPLEMGAKTPIETQRYSGELQLVQPLRWGTQLAFGLRQSEIQTTNPFRNCVPGIISEQCFESTLTLSINQPLLRGRSAEVNRSEEQGARFALEIVKHQFKIELIQQAQMIAQLYLQSTLAQAQIQLEENHLKLIEQRLTEAKERLDLGLIASTELYPLTAAKAQRKQSLLSAQGQYMEAKKELEILSTKVSIKTKFPKQLFNPLRLKALLTSTLPSWQNLSRFLMTENNAKQLEARRIVFQDAKKSQLNMGMIWSQSGLGESFGSALDALPERESRFYGITLTYQQALSNRADHQSAQLEAQVRAKKEEQQALIQELNLSWQRGIDRLKTKSELLVLAKEAQQATEKSARAAHERFKEGRTTLFEVLEMQNQSISAATQTIVIEHDIAQEMLGLWGLNEELLSLIGIDLK